MQNVADEELEVGGKLEVDVISMASDIEKMKTLIEVEYRRVGVYIEDDIVLNLAQFLSAKHQANTQGSITPCIFGLQI